MKPGSKVKVHYTGTLNDGTVFDSSKDRGPLEITIGNNEAILGFENGVKDMKVNEEKTIRIKPEEAYGQKNEQLIISVPRDKFPPEVQAGGRLILKGPQGQNIPAVVKHLYSIGER